MDSVRSTNIDKYFVTEHTKELRPIEYQSRQWISGHEIHIESYWRKLIQRPGRRYEDNIKPDPREFWFENLEFVELAYGLCFYDAEP